MRRRLNLSLDRKRHANRPHCAFYFLGDEFIRADPNKTLADSLARATIARERRLNPHIIVWTFMIPNKSIRSAHDNKHLMFDSVLMWGPRKFGRFNKKVNEGAIFIYSTDTVESYFDDSLSLSKGETLSLDEIVWANPNPIVEYAKVFCNTEHIKCDFIDMSKTYDALVKSEKEK